MTSRLPGPTRRAAGPSGAGGALGLWTELVRCAGAVGRVVADEARRHGLTGAQLGVLEVLHRAGPTPLSAIGARLAVTSGNVTFVADQLERAGLARRVRSGEDARVLLAQLTPKGRRVAARVLPACAARLRRLTGALEPRERAELAGLLARWGGAARAEGS